MAQRQARINSMLLVLADSKEDSNKVKLLNELSWEYLSTDSIRALSFGERAKTLAEKLDYSKGLITAQMRIGNVYERIRKYPQALEAYRSSMAISERTHDLYGTARANHQISVVYRNLSEYDNALKHEGISIELLRKIPEKRKSLALALNSLGNMYKDQYRFKEALTSYQEALQIREAIPDTLGIADSYNNIALVYELLGTYLSALSKHQMALKIYRNLNDTSGLAASFHNISNIHKHLNQLDSALYYAEESLDLQSGLTDETDRGDVIQLIGSVWEKKGNYTKALHYFQQALAIQTQASAKREMAESHYNIGMLHHLNGENNAALESLGISLDLARETELPNLQSTALEGIATVYHAQNNSEKALEYHLRSVSIGDSLSKLERQALDYDRKLLVGQHGQRILEQKLLVQKAESQNKIQLFYSLILGGVLLLIAAFAFLLSLRNKQRASIAEKDVKLRLNEIDDLIKTQEIKIMSAMVEGQDEERKRIAQDLHDRLGGILSVVRLHFSAVESNIHKMEAKNQEQYAIATELLNEASETVRAISHDIGDSMLMTLGLVPALQDMANTIEASQTLQVSVIHHGMNERLPSQMEIHLYKIVQELMSNILKHAEANHVSINLVRSGDQFSILVEDDGVGFDLDDPMNREGMGMVTMRARAKELEGTISIDSQPDHGTTTTFEMAWPTLENSLI